MKSLKKDLKTSLLQKGFSTAKPEDGEWLPAIVTPMLLPLQEIDFYALNPRRGVNDHYQDIKESIRERGLDHPLPVSKAPGEERYFIYKGGNTRLQALKELFEETGDDRFAMVRCDFHPFAGHLEGVAAHIRENELRGGMAFVDKAIGYMRIKQQLEEEAGEKLTLRQLAGDLKHLGLPTSIGQLSKMEYAVMLNAWLPTVLAGGCGSDQTQRLRKLETAAFEVFNHGLVLAANDPVDLDYFRANVFGPALSSTDRVDGWRYDEAQAVVEDSLAQALPMAVGHFAHEWLLLRLNNETLPAKETMARAQVAAEVLQKEEGAFEEGLEQLLGKANMPENPDSVSAQNGAELEIDLQDVVALQSQDESGADTDMPQSPQASVSGDALSEAVNQDSEAGPPGYPALEIPKWQQGGDGLPLQENGEADSLIRLQVSRSAVLELQSALQAANYALLLDWFDGLLEFSDGDSVRWHESLQQWEDLS